MLKSMKQLECCLRRIQALRAAVLKARLDYTEAVQMNIQLDAQATDPIRVRFGSDYLLRKDESAWLTKLNQARASLETELGSFIAAAEAVVNEGGSE